MAFQALTIAGSDSGGGAGIQADLKTFSALGVYGASVLTAVTAQNTRAVTGVEMISPKMIRAQMAAVFDDLAIGAVKIGMLGDPETITAVAEGLAGCAAPVVLDPVMVAKSGDALLSAEAVATLRDRMLPLAHVLTPNLPEAARLLDRPEATDEAAMLEQGRALLSAGPGAVMMKGGHGTGETCVDLLITADETLRLSAPRQHTANTHGTGCTLSAAIAAGLARGQTLQDAVQVAHAYLQRAITAADTLNIGSGLGPVHHFHAVWSHE
ncbi:MULTISPECIES: bifunctional hydroxymethylpyrimidine kinase/phosphomethylpyrimidine kinase [unclassified Sulfitobacter]|jgi:hydroxymethylpyrimidine/phosphomethylpyrimidine kinase|uniref:bifunctional hydroxymethylpyrimidine kinase/phosphomethylpyrimidine kinase n=2 Tax=Sulfitobacter TaxID=60136 RepID=UPI0007C277A5|nr:MULTISPECIES: bifunctional hydroxymethylpyrimidine kinase/phosphomethylpyrimidine kinase [unclassified Sulfitobacter]KZX90627.1 hydroxymethylpyrimidine/phosphomethylpyrimidine kinase [Sulfitobacter sp. HI0021]KZY00975.1 hydroxymethylpyrimidine/phosphomethylpyrimidine kinase [Sulfitobacter sp. HI0027]